MDAWECRECGAKWLDYSALCPDCRGYLVHVILDDKDVEDFVET